MSTTRASLRSVSLVKEREQQETNDCYEDYDDPNVQQPTSFPFFPLTFHWQQAKTWGTGDEWEGMEAPEGKGKE